MWSLAFEHFLEQSQIQSLNCQSPARVQQNINCTESNKKETRKNCSCMKCREDQQHSHLNEYQSHRKHRQTNPLKSNSQSKVRKWRKKGSLKVSAKLEKMPYPKININQYLEYSKKQGKNVHLAMKKTIIGQIVEQNNAKAKPTSLDNFQSQNTQPNQVIAPGAGLYRMSSQKIAQLLELRNKARRELNLAEADRIRNYLRNCGVCLIDEKCRRGRAMQVASWKYLF